MPTKVMVEDLPAKIMYDQCHIVQVPQQYSKVHQSDHHNTQSPEKANDHIVDDDEDTPEECEQSVVDQNNVGITPKQVYDDTMKDMKCEPQTKANDTKETPGFVNSSELMPDEPVHPPKEILPMSPEFHKDENKRNRHQSGNDIHIKTTPIEDLKAKYKLPSQQVKFQHPEYKHTHILKPLQVHHKEQCAVSVSQQCAVSVIQQCAVSVIQVNTDNPQTHSATVNSAVGTEHKSPDSRSQKQGKSFPEEQNANDSNNTRHMTKVTLSDDTQEIQNVVLRTQELQNGLQEKVSGNSEHKEITPQRKITLPNLSPHDKVRFSKNHSFKAKRKVSPVMKAIQHKLVNHTDRDMPLSDSDSSSSEDNIIEEDEMSSASESDIFERSALHLDSLFREDTSQLKSPGLIQETTVGAEENVSLENLAVELQKKVEQFIHPSDNDFTETVTCSKQSSDHNDDFVPHVSEKLAETAENDANSTGAKTETSCEEQITVSENDPTLNSLVGVSLPAHPVDGKVDTTSLEEPPKTNHYQVQTDHLIVRIHESSEVSTLSVDITKCVVLNVDNVGHELVINLKQTKSEKNNGEFNEEKMTEAQLTQDDNTQQHLSSLKRDPEISPDTRIKDFHASPTDREIKETELPVVEVTTADPNRHSSVVWEMVTVLDTKPQYVEPIWEHVHYQNGSPTNELSTLPDYSKSARLELPSIDLEDVDEVFATVTPDVIRRKPSRSRSWQTVSASSADRSSVTFSLNSLSSATLSPRSPKSPRFSQGSCSPKSPKGSRSPKSPKGSRSPKSPQGSRSPRSKSPLSPMGESLTSPRLSPWAYQTYGLHNCQSEVNLRPLLQRTTSTSSLPGRRRTRPPVKHVVVTPRKRRRTVEIVTPINLETEKFVSTRGLQRQQSVDLNDSIIVMTKL